MNRILSVAGLAAFVAACAGIVPAPAQQAASRPPASGPPGTGQSGDAAPAYAAIADLVIAGPVVIDAAIRSATRIKGAEAAAVPAGFVRFYIEADVLALVRSPGAMPPRVGYVMDAALDQAGRAPKLKKLRVLLFARGVPGSATQIQLVTPRSQLMWSPATDASVRKVVAEIVSLDAPPVVTGVGNAFHVPGSLPGEGETQIFLTTADSRPVSLSVLRRPGEQPRYAVALSEIVDDSAAPPARDTLLWYRLACSLPGALPDASVASMMPSDADLAKADYRFVLDQLGRCRRDIAR